MPLIGHFIHSLDPGGAEGIVLDLCEGVSEYGLGASVLHFGNPWIAEPCESRGIPSLEVPSKERFRSSKTLPVFAFTFRQFLRQYGVALLHAHLLGAIEAAALARLFGGVPAVGTLHDVYSLEEAPARIASLQLASLTGMRLVAVSERLRSFVMEHSRLYQPPVQTIYNGIDIPRLPEEANVGLRRKFDTAEDEFLAICVARLIGLKRVELVLHAVAELQKFGPMKLWVVGDGPERGVLESLAEELDVSGSVRFLGFRDNVSELLSVGDCFVLASDTEGLSKSVQEAMAAGLPCVLTDVGGNNELVEHGRSGFLVPRGDRDGLARSLGMLREWPRLRRETGEAARTRMEERFSVGRMVKSYVALYGELLESRRTT